jgi:hypothetical protein
MVFDVGRAVGQVERLKVLADLDALVERFEAFELKEMAQVRLADHEERQMHSLASDYTRPGAGFPER